MRIGWLALAIVVATLTLTAPSARASTSLSGDQQRALDTGELVVAPLEYARGDQHFVGGVSYFVASAPIERLSMVARDPARWRALLPNVESAELVSVSKAGVARVRVTHRLGFTRGGYTLVCAFQDHGRFGRFWLDLGADNALEDGWGFVRLTPLSDGRTLITYGLLFDLGPGLLHALFEGRIRRAALEYPRRLAHAAS